MFNSNADAMHGVYEVGVGLRPRQILTFSYTIQNILISLGTVICSTASLIFTISIILPFSLVRGMFPALSLALMPPQQVLRRGGKVVLIVGASRGIGLEVLKKYGVERNTTIIAAPKSAESLRNALIELGDAPAIIQMERLDLNSSAESISRSVEELDKKYGPITHLYAIGGISNHLNDSTAWNMGVTEEMIKLDIMGTIALSVAMYEKMKSRKYGKICIVSSVAGIYSPANMISDAPTKSFIYTFSTSLRVLAAASNVDVVTVEPGFIDTRMGQGSSVPGFGFGSAEGLAGKMKACIEKGGVGVVSSVRQSVMMYAFRGLNPICEELGEWASMMSKMSGKKIT